MDYELKSRFNNPEFYKRLLKYNNLSYRRWNRLPEYRQKDFKELNLYPSQLNLALKLDHLFKKENRTESASIAAMIALRIFHGYHNFITTIPMEQRILYGEFKIYSEQYVVKELKFQGFIPLRRFRKHWNKKCSYVISRQLGKHRYIHPFPMSEDYELRVKLNLPNVWDHFSLFGLSGCTGIIHPKDLKELIKNNR